MPKTCVQPMQFSCCDMIIWICIQMVIWQIGMCYTSVTNLTRSSDKMKQIERDVATADLFNFQERFWVIYIDIGKTAVNKTNKITQHINKLVQYDKLACITPLSPTSLHQGEPCCVWSIRIASSAATLMHWTRWLSTCLT